jgi:Zn-dependent M28 family amino/carboxypeptidase
VIEYLRSFLTERADSVRLDEFALTDSTGKELELTNIIAMFRPDHRSRILLCCHYDTRPISDEAVAQSDRHIPVPGANDGASGTAVLMEVANVLSKSQPPVGVDLVFFDGEDNPGEMLLGSREFAQRYPDYKPLFGILVDMVGDKDLSIKKELYSDRVAPEIVNRVWRKAYSLGYGSIFRQEVGYAVVDDHIPLLRSGIRCIDVIDFDYPHWHTPDDTPDKCSSESLEIVSEVLVSLIFDLR